MGCDYFVDKEKDQIVIRIRDYNSSNGQRFERNIRIPTHKFTEDGKMNLEIIKGAERR